MSEFSTMLGSLIEEKGVKVYTMAKYCLLDRSTMYKLINGARRPPGEEVFQKMADFMRLTPLEYDEFFKAYKISVLGEEVYYKRKNMEEFMCNFPSSFSMPPLRIKEGFAPSEQIKWEKQVPDFTAITNQMELNHTIYHMFLAEAQRPQGRIGMMIQPDESFVFTLLTGQLSMKNHLQVDHLVCLDSASRMTENHESYTLMYLKNLLPMYASALDYHAYYFYDNIPSHYYNFSGMPFVILTEDFALTCRSDYSSGFFYQDKKAVELLWAMFEEYKSKCEGLFRVLATVQEECDTFGSIDVGASENYFIQPEPCLLPYVTREMLEQGIQKRVPEREKMIAYLWDYLQKKKEAFPGKNMYMYHTEKGILCFAGTGRLSDIPVSLARPFTPAERKRMLIQLKSDCGQYPFYLLKRPLSAIPHDFHLWVSDSCAFLLFSNVYHKRMYLSIQEPGLLEDMLDYARSIREDWLYSTEEMTEFIQRVIDSIKDEE